MGSVNELLSRIPLPRMLQVQQEFQDDCLADVAQAVRDQLRQERITETIRPGMRIAITAGSRGVNQIDIVLREIVSFLKERKAEPFIIPTMGSHGGSTAEGQADILRAYHITAETMGCPIRATMEVKQIGTLDNGQPVLIDRYAAEADGIVVVNRVKPHTAFRGTFESGLMKMMAIGLGKQAGAEVVHRDGILKIGPNVERFSRAILASSNIVFGVGLVENAYDKTAIVRAIPGGLIPEEEPLLLAQASRAMARILFDSVDVLIVDRIGKDISGEGMDPNISGRWIVPTVKGGIDATRVAVLDLTDESLGNGVGLGMADVCSRRAMLKMDTDHSYPNLLTSKVTRLCAIPMYFDNHRYTIQAAIKMVPEKSPEEVSVIRIANTLSMRTISISENLLEKALATPGIRVLGKAEEMRFDEKGDLFP